MGFTILVFAQLFNALSSRSHLQSAFVGLFSNKWLWGCDWFVRGAAARGDFTCRFLNGPVRLPWH